jgi:hypothetical protein
MDMPIQRFWLLSENVSRVLAEESQRLIRVIMAATVGGDVMKDVMGEIEHQLSTVSVEQERDEKGINRLKELARG